MGEEEYLVHWKAWLKQTPGALYLRIVEAIDRSIQKAELREGDQLPTQRAIANYLGTNLSTVTHALKEARRRGLVEAVVGRGTFVKGGATNNTFPYHAESIVDLTMNLPPVPEDSSLRKMLQTDLSAILRRPGSINLMAYRTTGGTFEERSCGVRWIAPILGKRKADHVLVAPGAQAALAAILSARTVPGDRLATDRTTYPGLRMLARQFNLTLVGIESDKEGIIPSHLEEMCVRYQPKFLYCNPSLQNPTTATMSVHRRHDILTVARCNEMEVIEDDPYSLLMTDPPPALAALDPLRVIYIATLSKTLSPGLRTAFVALPSEEMTRQVMNALRAIVLSGSGLLSELASSWIQSGKADGLLRGIRKEISLRQNVAGEMLELKGAPSREAPHIWMRLPKWWESHDFVAYARRFGLSLAPGSAFAIDGVSPSHVRIALGSAPNIECLKKSLQKISGLLSDVPSSGFQDIV